MVLSGGLIMRPLSSSVTCGAIETINRWFDEGHHIIIFTARRMRTCEGDVEKVIEMVGEEGFWRIDKYNDSLVVYMHPPQAD